MCSMAEIKREKKQTYVRKKVAAAAPVGAFYFYFGFDFLSVRGDNIIIIRLHCGRRPEQTLALGSASARARARRRPMKSIDRRAQEHSLLDSIVSFPTDGRTFDLHLIDFE